MCCVSLLLYSFKTDILEIYHEIITYLADKKPINSSDDAAVIALQYRQNYFEHLRDGLKSNRVMTDPFTTK